MFIQSSYFEMVTVALKEIKTGSDRVAGIVTPAFLENLLTKVLCNHFHQDTKVLSTLFNPGRAIGDFGVKTDLAFLVGVISDKARKDLIRIRKIRNAFAHDYVLNSFEASPVSDLAMALTIPDWYKFDGVSKPSNTIKQETIRVPSDKDMTKLSTPRGRFNVSCKCFVTALAFAEPPAPANPKF